MERDTHRAARVGLRHIAVSAIALAALLLPAAIGADPGFVPGSHGVAGEVRSAPPGDHPHPGQKNAGQAGSTGNLTYHGGPVLHSNTTYTIYWSPGNAIDSSYESTINQFFGDVAADSGKTTNVYSTDPQYTDSTGKAAYSSSYGGSWVDAQTPIPDHCSGEYAGTGAKVSGCVLDSDLQAEVSRALSANPSWSTSNGIFFVFTPKNVGSCVDTTSNECAYTYYCAYHWYFNQGGQTVVYANQPYTDTSGVGVLYAHACDSGQQPNGSWADSTINVASHEHNESVTDPLGNAWYDSAGNEDGDKCAWNFGSSSGSTSTGAYNQVIDGHDYYLQQEWNNASSGCVQNTTPPAQAPTVSSFSPGDGAPGTSVSISGANFTGATAVKFNGVSASFTAGSDTQLTATVPGNATTGPITVTTPAGTGSSSTSFKVDAPDFTIAATPASQSIRRGSSTSYTVTVTATTSTGSSVRLTASGLPNGGSGSFSPSTVTSTQAGATSTLRVGTRSNTRAGTYTLTITGTTGTLSHSTSVTLNVN